MVVGCSPPLSVLFDILYKNKTKKTGNSSSAVLNFIAPVIPICPSSEVFTNAISDSDNWEIFVHCKKYLYFYINEIFTCIPEQ